MTNTTLSTTLCTKRISSLMCKVSHHFARLLFCLGIGLGCGTACVTTSSRPPTPLTVDQVPPDEKAARQKKSNAYWCFYRHNRWAAWNLPLRVQPNLPVFADIRSYRAGLRTYLKLPQEGPERGIYVDVSAQGVHIRGWLKETQHVPFYMNRPVPIGNTILLNTNARLFWKGYQHNRLVLEFKAPHEYQPLSSLLIHAPCAHTSIQARSHAGLRSLLPLSRSSKTVWLPSSVRIPVSATAGGEPEGHLYFRHYSPDAEWLDQQGSHIRIYVARFGYAVTGWIPASVVLPRAPSQAGGMGILGALLGRGGVAKPVPLSPQRFICRQPTRLHLQDSGQRWHVGTLLKGTIFHTISEEGGWTSIQLHSWQKWLWLRSGFRWQIRTADLLHCRLIQPPSRSRPTLP